MTVCEVWSIEQLSIFSLYPALSRGVQVPSWCACVPRCTQGTVNNVIHRLHVHTPTLVVSNGVHDIDYSECCVLMAITLVLLVQFE